MIYLPRYKFGSRIATRTGMNRNALRYFLNIHWHGGLQGAVTLFNAAYVSINDLGFGRDATYGSGLSSGTGPFGQCLKFDGTSNGYVDCGTSLLHWTTDHTLSFWCLCDVAPTTDQTFWNDTNNIGNPTYRIHTQGTTGKMEWDSTAAGGALVGTTALVQGTWNHVVCTFSTTGGGCKMYLNGELDATSAGVGVDVGQGTKSSMGVYFQGGSHLAPLTGRMDNVAIWYRALSMWEVRQLFDIPLILLGEHKRRLRKGTVAVGRGRSYVSIL